MLSLGGNQRVFLYRQPVDFRRAHDGLCALVRDTFSDDPFAGDVFVVHNSIHPSTLVAGCGRSTVTSLNPAASSWFK